MSTIRQSVPVGSRGKTILVALGLTAAGSLAGLLGALVVQWVAAAAVSTVTDAVYVVSSRGVQVGYAAFALAFLWYADGWERYARFRRPGTRDAAAVVAGFLALLVVGEATTAVLSAAGLPTEAVVGDGRDLSLASRPLLWPLAFVAWMVFAAPAEELFYRGIVQTRLREAFPAAGAVLLGAACFGLSHAAFSVLSGAGGPTVAATGIALSAVGLVFCGLYEVTDNLVPVAVFHGLTWLDPLHAAEAVLQSLL